MCKALDSIPSTQRQDKAKQNKLNIGFFKKPNYYSFSSLAFGMCQALCTYICYVILVSVGHVCVCMFACVCTRVYVHAHMGAMWRPKIDVRILLHHRSSVLFTEAESLSQTRIQIYG